MRNRRKLFFSRSIYDLPRTDALFVAAMRENVAFHTAHCHEYKDLLDRIGFDISSVRSIDDIGKIPPLPTSYLKNHTLCSKNYKHLLIKTTSSGTSGRPAYSGFDAPSALCAGSMVLRVFRRHGLWTARRSNYIILGYEPSKNNQTAMAKALRGVTYLSPPRKVVYALKYENGEYSLQTETIVAAVRRFAERKTPVRIIGFPAYLKMFIDELDERGIVLSLPKNSKILIGGGWKGAFGDEIPKSALISMAQRTFGITPENFKDHFSTAEHPINYIACERGHFHVPIYSRVLIRDVETLEPVGYGRAGLLNLITPVLSSVPYGSIITDDIAVLRDGGDGGCEINSPYFELIGRVGMADLKTCSQIAAEFLKNE